MKIEYSEKDGLMTAVVTDNKGLVLNSKSTCIASEMAEFLDFAVKEYHEPSAAEAKDAVIEFIADDEHRTENFSDIEICSDEDYHKAWEIIDKTLDAYSDEDMIALYKAIREYGDYLELIEGGWKTDEGYFPKSAYPITLGTFTFSVERLEGGYRISSEHDGNFDGETDVATTKRAGELFADFIETIEEGLM